MAKMNIKKGDKVVVIAGKNKGKEGEVLRTVPETSRVVVQDVNMIKKAMKPTQQNPQGGISTFEAPIHVSNVMLICPECKKPTRVGRTRIAHPNKDGKTIGVRVCKKCNAQIDKIGK